MITIKFFAMLKQILGDTETTVDASEAATVADLIKILEARYPAIGDSLEKTKSRVAVNHEFAGLATPLKDGDEVAFIPPMSGGSGLVRIQTEDFSVDEEIARVKQASGRVGGIAVFLGTARDLSKGKEIDRLEFEHYPGMAEKQLELIRREALRTYDIIEVGIVHRVGTIGISENIVLIVVGAEHRQDAFTACRWCIDELKQITPIWKKEITPEGDFWVELHP
jgi:MoaE-MoaD fusion protein